ncbi:response regulator [Fulvivirga ligni]|uniref:response regulator n=1 Tax=Fulvivirga ligni TaxID=2904246 RepID=UPI001F4406BA|nr:response regulator [Fulvivirga ligni]UII20977.1 ATP-binding protein [Fulvivirga ligni]
MTGNTKIPSVPSSFEEIVESLEDMIYELDHAGCFKYANNSLAKYSGYSKEELKKIRYFDIVKEDQRNDLVQFYKRQRDTKTKDSYYEFAMVAKDGSLIWVGQNVRMIFQDDIVLSIRAVARNINQLKVTEDKLKHNESQLDELLAHIDLFNQITLSNHINDTEQINRAIEILATYFNMPLAVISKIENNILEVIDSYATHPSMAIDKNKIYDLNDTYCHIPYQEKKIVTIENISASNHTIRPGIADFKIECFIGVPIWVNGMCYGTFSLLSPDKRPLPFNKREIEFIWLVCNWLGNTIEKLAYETQLQKQSALLSQAQSMANIGHWEIDLIKNTMFWSSITKQIHDVSLDYIPTLEKSIDFYDEQSKPIMKELLSRAIKTGEGWDIKLGIISAKKNRTWVRSIGTVEWKGDHAVKIVGVFQDFTREKVQEEELLYAKEEAEKASQAKADFLSVMSHEIRTPLNAVIGLSHILLEEEPQKHQLENLNTLKFSAENLLALINDILDFNKIEAGKVSLELIDFNLLNILNGIKQSLVLRAKKQKVDIHLRIDPKVPEYVVGDSTRLSQILNNLSGNAIKFTNEGSITLSAHVTEDHGDTVDIEFSVKDTGIGIAPDKINNIFDQFTQAEKETTRKYGGTGLGLAITKKLTHLMNSEIKVDSTLGEGSNFHFTISFRKSDYGIQKESFNNSEDIDAQLKDLKVLLVEDNMINQMVAMKFLRMWGIAVDQAENGKEALYMVANNAYDLILMDLQMPEMDGYTASRQIRRMSEKHEEIPIIALTASALSDIRTDVMNAGMNDFVSKPFNPRDLQEKILFNINREFRQPPLTETTKAPAKPQFINLNKLEALADKNIPLMIKLLQTFIIELGKFRDQYIKALVNKDLEDIEATHHRILPTLKMLEIRLLDEQINKGRELLQDKKYDKKAANNNARNVKQLSNTIIDLCEKRLKALI